MKATQKKYRVFLAKFLQMTFQQNKLLWDHYLEEL
jgi:hypothetical protein